MGFSDFWARAGGTNIVINTVMTSNVDIRFASQSVVDNKYLNDSSISFRKSQNSSILLLLLLLLLLIITHNKSNTDIHVCQTFNTGLKSKYTVQMYSRLYEWVQLVANIL